MNKKKNLKKWIFIFSIAVCAIILANLGASMNIIGTITLSLLPIMIGAIVAYILYLPERKIEKCFMKLNKNNFFYKKRRVFSIIIIYILAGLVIYGIVNILTPIVYNSVSDFISNMPKYYKTIEESKILDSEVGSYIVQQVENIDFSKYLSIGSIFNYIKNTISVAKGIFSLFVSLIVSVYLLSARTKLLEFWKKQVKANVTNEGYKKICKYSVKVNEIFQSYLSSQIIDSIVVGIVAVITLSILKVKYSVVLGMIIGISNLIPFFGAIFGIGFSIIIIALTTGINNAIVAGIIIIILQQLDANIINPKITSRQVDISPIYTITAITIAGAVFGVLGMFLAVPVAATIKTIMVDSAEEKLKRSKRK